MMSETQLLTIAGMIVAALFGVLAAIVGWIGSRVIEKLDAVVAMLHQVADELHARINKLDHRITVVETRCGAQHVHKRVNDE